MPPTPHSTTVDINEANYKKMKQMFLSRGDMFRSRGDMLLSRENMLLSREDMFLSRRICFSVDGYVSQ